MLNIYGIDIKDQSNNLLRDFSKDENHIKILQTIGLLPKTF
jgi:hypothetical protein